MSNPLLNEVAVSVGAGKLAPTARAYNYPPVVPGRVVHIDADFLAYQVSAESKEELDPDNPRPRKSFEDMQHNARVAVEHIMRLSGGERYHLHTTPSGSTKGGRGNQVVLKEYQANRADRTGKPEFLDAIRAFLISDIGSGGRGTAHLTDEADDGMAAAAWSAHFAGKPELVVVASQDKDLRMCPGYQLIDDEVRTFEGTFGFIELDRSKTAPKVTGRGTKFFWAQCLMGDKADNISGIPEVTGKYWLKAQPSAAYWKLYDKIESIKEAGGTVPVNMTLDLASMESKTKKCGAVLAYDLLRDCTTDRECYDLVLGAWKDLGARGHKFEHWRTGQEVKPTQALLGDMYALWMRRNNNPKDVISWLGEIK